MIPKTIDQTNEVLFDFLQECRETINPAIPTVVRCALSTILHELARLRAVENENFDLRTRIMEEQTLRATLEMIIASTPRRQTLSLVAKANDFDGKVAIH